MTTKTLIFRPDESGKITATITEALVMEYAKTVPEAGKRYKESA